MHFDPQVSVSVSAASNQDRSKMKTLVIVLLGLVGAVVGQVDWSQCGWEHGTTKNDEWCPNGYVATGACANKGSKKCDSRSAFSIRCCRLTHAEGKEDFSMY